MGAAVAAAVVFERRSRMLHEDKLKLEKEPNKDRCNTKEAGNHAMTRIVNV